MRITGENNENYEYNNTPNLTLKENNLNIRQFNGLGGNRLEHELD